MTNETSNIFRCVAAALVMFAAFAAFPADGDADAAAGAQGEEAGVDAALQAEMDYIEALVDAGFSDFAAVVIDQTKKKWPESEVLLFAIEVRGLLSMNKFEEADAKIASLPDRNGLKYWAARLEMANNYHARGKKKECEAIYTEFFKKFEKPPKEIEKFYRDACWTWGRLLSSTGRYADAIKVNEKLLAIFARTKAKSQEDEGRWCDTACDTAEMYIKLAQEVEKPADRRKYTDPAKKLVDELLWDRERYWLFGRAVAMKANLDLLGGDVARAQATINDYYPSLKEIHDNLAKAEAEGHRGWLNQSPLPICRFLLAQLLWKEAQAEYRRPKRSDSKIFDLLLGPQVPGKKKRNGNGAYNHAINVFVKYSWSSWAAPAGDLAEEIRLFIEKSYGRKLEAKITPEQMAKVRAAQFRNAAEKYEDGDRDGAMADYEVALAGCPESVDSVLAVERMAMDRLNRIARGTGSDADKAEWRMDADAIEGYVAERFAGSRDRLLMTEGGNAAQRLASVEKERGEKERSESLYKAFLYNYRRHGNAAPVACSLACERQKDGDFAGAMEYWDIICSLYTNTVQYATALSLSSTCHEKMGDRPRAIEALLRYCAVEDSVLKRIQAQMRLAQLYMNDGQAVTAAASTNETEEAAAAQVKEGSAQIVRAMMQFRDFAATCEKMLSDPVVPGGEKKSYGELRENALFLEGDCWRKLAAQPSDKQAMYRGKSVEAFEKYVEIYPQGRHAKQAYLLLGSMYTTLGNMEGTRNALDRLGRFFPDSSEAKNAMPWLARNLVEMGLRKEGTEIYANMLKTDGAYTALQFVNAGEALIEASSWDLADQAFEKAMAMDAANKTVVARARIGQAKSLYKQKSLSEARTQIDLFLQDEKMSRVAIAADAYLLLAEIAAEQGRTEADDATRRKHFNAAVGAIRKLRGFWSKRPVEEQDRIELMSADVVIKRIDAEEKMHLDRQANDTTALAAQMLQTFLQTRAPDEDHPLSSMSEGAKANLEEAYAKMIPLFSRLGDGQADRVLSYGAQYLEYFPDGRSRAAVVNCMNIAKSAVSRATPASADGAPEPEGGNEGNEN